MGGWSDGYYWEMQWVLCTLLLPKYQFPALAAFWMQRYSIGKECHIAPRVQIRLWKPFDICFHAFASQHQILKTRSIVGWWYKTEFVELVSQAFRWYVQSTTQQPDNRLLTHTDPSRPNKFSVLRSLYAEHFPILFCTAYAYVRARCTLYSECVPVADLHIMQFWEEHRYTYLYMYEKQLLYM